MELFLHFRISLSLTRCLALLSLSSSGANPSFVVALGDKGLISFVFAATEALRGYLVAMVTWQAVVVLVCLLLLS